MGHLRVVTWIVEMPNRRPITGGGERHLRKLTMAHEQCYRARMVFHPSINKMVLKCGINISFTRTSDLRLILVVTSGSHMGEPVQLTASCGVRLQVPPQHSPPMCCEHYISQRSLVL